MEELTSYIKEAPEAVLTLLDYDITTGTLPIQITDIENVEGDIMAVNVAVWTEEGQADLQWMQAAPNENGEYVMDINIASFGYRTENYHIDVYAVPENGKTVFLTGTTAAID